MTGFVRYPDPRLAKAAALSDRVDNALRAVGDRLLEAAEAAKAYGIAGAHIGEVAPVVVVSPDVEPRAYTLLFNPTVVAVSDDTAKGEEGSVSLPDVRVEVLRPVWADIAFMDRGGVSQTRRFDGFEARVVLHEIDQMQGIFFLDRISRLKREMALKRARKLAG